MLTRVNSSLSPDLEALIERVIGCLIEVHRQLGPGFLESTYQRATCIELGAQAIPFEKQKVVEVTYRGEQIHGQRLDLVVDQRLVLEIKAVSHLEPIHGSQLVSYLTATNLRAGLLVNFNSLVLKNGLKRIVR
jgi:GxxExxY protein